MNNLEPGHLSLLHAPDSPSTDTFVRCLFLHADYDQYMRHYNTKQVGGGGVRFSCIRCRYIVNTLDFFILNGNLRTQAAAAINQHSASEHAPKLFSFKPIVRVTPPTLGPQQAVWPRPN